MGGAGAAELGCELLCGLSSALNANPAGAAMAEIQSAPSQWPRFEGRFSDAAGLRVGVVVARFNDLVTAKLLSGCLDCLKRHGVDVSETSSQLDVAWVPGSFELPIVAQQMARSGQYQVLITLGAVIRGDTPHFDVVVAEASKGVAAVARDTAVPVIFGVLTTDTMQQALERAVEQPRLELRSGGLGDGQPDEGASLARFL